MPKNKFRGILIASTFWTALGLCQTPQGFLNGRIEPIEGSSLDLSVEVRNVTNHLPAGRESVGADGSFHFRDLASGSYEVRVVRAINNQTLVQDVIEVNPLGAQVLLHIPGTQAARPVSGLVSVRELQSRVPKKAFQAFVKAQHYAETGRPAEAIGQLRRALELEPEWRDAHVNLGAELIKAARYEEGLAELQEAIRIGPATAMIYTNYAAGLVTVHRAAEGEKAVREALRLDASFWRAHYMLGHILAMQAGRDKESLDHLHAGATEVPSSRIVAAQVLLRAGNRPGALAELREYLKSGDRTHRAQVQQYLAELERK